MLFFEIDIEQKLTKLYSQSFSYNPFLMYSQGGDHALLKASLQYYWYIGNQGDVKSSIMQH